MSSEDTKILESNQYQKSVKAPFIIYTMRIINFKKKKMKLLTEKSSRNQ